MVPLNKVIRSALSRGLPTWREKVSFGIIVFTILLCIALIRDAHYFKAYWEKPLTCRGPDFREPLSDPDSAPDEPRSIFRMSDQVVLAIPRHYLGGPWDENLPGTILHCGSISDLPQIQHLYIRIRGRWSGTYDVRELPRDNNGDLEYPDIVGLDVLPPDMRPAAAAQKPTWNRAFINDFKKNFPDRSLVSEENGILCGGNMCWFPVPGEDDLYGTFGFPAGRDKEPNFSFVTLGGVPYLGLDISGRVTLRDAYRTLPAVILSVQAHLGRWNIVRPKEADSPQVGKKATNTQDSKSFP
jgi:hypothetical protein